MGKRKEEIPQTAGELTAAFFTAAIGPTFGGTVSEVATEPIGEGVGFMGELHRCHLTWDGAGAEAPGSVVAKLPSSHDKNRSLGEALQVYEREIRMYSGLRDELGLPMPAYYYSAMDPNPAPWLEKVVVTLFERLPVGGVGWLLDQLLKVSGKARRRYLLVMEDIADARPPTQIEGGSPDDALRGLELLAGFHAANWMDQSKIDREPVIWDIDRTPKVVQASYRRNRDAFAERFAHLLGPARLERMDEVQEQLPELGSRLVAEPWALIHGDYRLDNLLFRSDGSTVVLDFQGVGKGRPGWDVAYFITTALEPHHRSEERQMLETYHRALVGHGIDDYSFDDLVTDCQLTKDLLAHRLVAGDELLDTDRAGEEDALLDVLVERVAGWIHVE